MQPQPLEAIANGLDAEAVNTHSTPLSNPTSPALNSQTDFDTFEDFLENVSFDDNSYFKNKLKELNALKIEALQMIDEATASFNDPSSVNYNDTVYLDNRATEITEYVSSIDELIKENEYYISLSTTTVKEIIKLFLENNQRKYTDLLTSYTKRFEEWNDKYKCMDPFYPKEALLELDRIRSDFYYYTYLLTEKNIRKCLLTHVLKCKETMRDYDEKHLEKCTSPSPSSSSEYPSKAIALIIKERAHYMQCLLDTFYIDTYRYLFAPKELLNPAPLDNPYPNPIVATNENQVHKSRI